jgi:hypothetical protein
MSSLSAPVVNSLPLYRFFPRAAALLILTVLSLSASVANAAEAMPAVATQEYSIGNPTGEEQLYLEYINRARANPVAEAMRLATTTDPDVLQAYGIFGVNLVMMQAQFGTLAPQPPYSINALLVSAARAHSQNMLNLMYQGHGDVDGGPSTIGQRLLATGYANGATSYSFGENVFAFARSVFYGYVGFEVDWGGPTGGMQVPPGHRLNDHSANFREIGIGVVNGTHGPVGPQLVTQDFATRGGLGAFITGVVYTDRNGNGFYDVGEGLAGVRIDVPGSNFFAITGQSGGYSVPVPGDGVYMATFSGGSLPISNQAVTIRGGQNAKLDYVAAPTGGGSNSYLFNISTRLRILSGDNVGIGGFIVRGTQPKKVLVKAIGPSLPVPGALANPTLELYGAAGLIASNDNWRTNQQAQIMASNAAPTNDFESAIVATLPANDSGYTTIVRGANGTTGVGRVDVVDLDQTVDSKLINISTRGIVDTGDNAMIGGFIIGGTQPMRVIVRAIGPSLPVPGALTNPKLQLINAAGVVVRGNDNWKSDQPTEIVNSTVPPTNDLESAVVSTLAPGGYTVIVRGVNDTTGVARVEAFALP